MLIIWIVAIVGICLATLSHFGRNLLDKMIFMAGGFSILIIAILMSLSYGSTHGLYSRPLSIDEFKSLKDNTYTVVHQQQVDGKPIALIKSASGKLMLICAEVELPQEFAVFTYPGKKPEVLPSKDGQVQLIIPVNPPANAEAISAAVANPPAAESADMTIEPDTIN